MPTPLPTDPAEFLDRLTELVREKVESVPDAGHVFTDVPYSDDLTAYVRKMAVDYKGKKVVRAVEVVPIRFPKEIEYTSTTSMLTIRYGLTVIREFVDRYGDGTNSTPEFRAFCMRLRDAFRRDRTFGYRTSEIFHQFLQMQSDFGVVKSKDGGFNAETAIWTLDVEVFPTS
jgi:hypothetical protein